MSPLTKHFFHLLDASLPLIHLSPLHKKKKKSFLELKIPSFINYLSLTRNHVWT